MKKDQTLDVGFHSFDFTRRRASSSPSAMFWLLILISKLFWRSLRSAMPLSAHLAAYRFI